MFYPRKFSLISLCMAVLVLAGSSMGTVRAQEGKQAADAAYNELYCIENTPFYRQPNATAAGYAGIIPSGIIPYPVVQRQDNWIKVHYNNQDVWIKVPSPTAYVKPIAAKSGEDTVPEQSYMYLHYPAVVYQEADPTGKRLMDIDPQRIQVLKRNGEWYQIRTDYGPGWIYDGVGYITNTLGVRKITITKSVPLYRYATTLWPSAGNVLNVPYETTAYENFGNWYKVYINGDFYWFNAAPGEVETAPAVFTGKSTQENGFVGNTTFMTAPKTTRPGDLLHRMVISRDGKPEVLFQTFIVRPAGSEERGFLFESFPANTMDANQVLSKYVSDLFSAGDQMDQLERAALKVRALTGKDDYRTKVIIGMPNPTGIEPLQRVQLNLDYINEVIQKWKEVNPQALELVGFYWTNESVPEADREVVQSIADLIHSKGYKFYWAPYFQAANEVQWKTLGFDFAWLQPNYYFNRDKHPGEDMLGETYNLSRQTGAGTMLEWNWDFLTKPDEASALNAYLDRGLLIGANQTSVLVYDGEGAVDAFFSDYNKGLDPIRQKLFDYLLKPTDSGK